MSSHPPAMACRESPRSSLPCVGSSTGGTHREKRPRGPLKILNDTLKTIPAISSLRATDIEALARDIWAVAIGIRCAHLVDKLHLSVEDVDLLAQTLPLIDALPELRQLVLLCEQETEQTFICNASLTRTLVDRSLAGEPSLIGQWWVAVEGSKPELMSPEYALEVTGDLEVLSKAFPDGPSRPGQPLVVRRFNLGDENPAISVSRRMTAIAGWLCCYIVVYCFRPTAPGQPTGEGYNALSGEPLWKVGMKLYGVKTKDDHILGSFTMPTRLFYLDDSSTPLSGVVPDDTVNVPVQVVTDRLQNLLTSRLEAYNENCARTNRKPIWNEVDVFVDGPVTLHRVAL